MWPVLAMAAPADGGANPLGMLLSFGVVIGIFYFIVLLPMKRKQKKVQEFLSTLKVNDRVVTTGGIYGTITKVNEKSVQLQVADKVRIEIARAAIGVSRREPCLRSAFPHSSRQLPPTASAIW